MTPRYRFLLRGAGLLWLAGAVVGCQRTDPKPAELPPPPVSVSHPVVRDVIDHDDYEGRVAATQKVELRTRAKGFLQKILFKDGEVVEAGKVLFQIDPRPYEASLEAAEAQEKAADGALDFARSEYARVKRLVADRAASREEMEVWTAKQILAKADKLKAKSAITQAQLDLEYTRVKAPFAGRVGRNLVDEGALINSGGGDTLLTTLVSVGPVFVYFNIDERSLLRYRQDFRKPKVDGKEPTVAELKIPVHVALEGEEGYPHTGVIDYGAPQVDAGTGTLEVRGRLENKAGLLQDGMRARVRVPVSDPRKTVLITERAVASEQGRKYVFVVNKDDVVERRDVSLGRAVDGLQVVLAGLKLDDRVVVNGIQRVREGLTVKPNEVPMPDGAPKGQAAQPAPARKE